MWILGLKGLQSLGQKEKQWIITRDKFHMDESVYEPFLLLSFVLLFFTGGDKKETGNSETETRTTQ